MWAAAFHSSNIHNKAKLQEKPKMKYENFERHNPHHKKNDTKAKQIIMINYFTLSPIELF